jgi:hypothetical protein
MHSEQMLQNQQILWIKKFLVQIKYFGVKIQTRFDLFFWNFDYLG